MNKHIIAVLLLSILYCATAQNWISAGTSRYWDCSKPHCAWRNNLPDQLPYPHRFAFKLCKDCPYGAKYWGTGAAATVIMGGNDGTAACGKCFALRAEGSSTVSLILEANNLCPGYANPLCDGGKHHFDIAAPGFDWSTASASDTCRQNDPSLIYRGAGQVCMINNVKECNCDQISTDPELVAGCKLFVELGWNNQRVEYTPVQCPSDSQKYLPGASAPTNPPTNNNNNNNGNNGNNGGSCAGVNYAFEAGNPYWIEVNAPANANVKIQCNNPWQEIECTPNFGKYQCKPNGACPQNTRVALVNGQKCFLDGGARAEAEEEELAVAEFPEEEEDEAVMESFNAEVDAQAVSEEVAFAIEEDGDDGDDNGEDTVALAVEDSNNVAVAATEQQPDVPSWAVGLFVVGAILFVVLVGLMIFLAKLTKI